MQGTGIATDYDGNAYAIGTYESTATFGSGEQTISLTNAGAESAFVSKSSASGEVLWAKRIFGNSEVLGTDIAVSETGNLYITGLFVDTIIFASPTIPTLYGDANQDVFVIKMDAEGNFIWAKAFTGPWFSIGRSIAVDGDENVVVTGSFKGTVDFDPGLESFEISSSGIDDVFTVKLSSEGDFIWAKAFLGTESNIGNGVDIDPEGNVYTTGWFGGTADFDPGSGSFELNTVSGSAVFVSKLDTQGGFVWAKQFAGNGSNGLDIKLDGDGNIITCGRFVALQDFDPGPDQSLLGSEGSVDGYISKLDNDGNYLWAKRFGGTLPDAGISLDVDGLGNVYTSGFFHEEATLSLSSGEETLTGAGNRDVFVSKITPDGQFEWAFGMGGSGRDGGADIAVDANGNVYTIGEFEETAQFNASELTALGETDTFITIHTQSLNTADLETQIEPLTVYPNPGTDEVRLDWSTDTRRGLVDIIDMHGRTVYSETVRIRPHLTDVTHLAPGFYLVRFSDLDSDRIFLGKLMLNK